MEQFEQRIIDRLSAAGAQPEEAGAEEWYHAVGAVIMEDVLPRMRQKKKGKRAAYFSAEFLLGRMVNSNLFNLGLLDRVKALMQRYKQPAALFEEIEDLALGNGGLGRLAACFLDSAATHDLPLDGYGIRYRYGLFRQDFTNGYQTEAPDDWTRQGDPFSVRRAGQRVPVRFGDGEVWAVPYDMPVIGFDTQTVNRLRLWQAEPVHPIDFEAFNAQAYDQAFLERNRAEAISAVLYPNDDTLQGKRLRLKQQYFFCSASLQSILSDYKQSGRTGFSDFGDFIAIQLNDTHPAVAIPELLRLLTQQESLPFDTAFDVVRKTFSYTNHTIMAEAMEKWDCALFSSVLPEVYAYVVMLQNHLRQSLIRAGVPQENWRSYDIIKEGRVHMANLAVYATHAVNGVARLHTDLLKKSVLSDWYALYPERFHNQTNGITQRRWLGLCNPELAGFINERIGRDWLKDLSALRKLDAYLDDEASLRQFTEIKREKKNQLAEYVWQRDGFGLHTDFVFDIQIKRLHEYKRQLLNAFSILDLYFTRKENPSMDFPPVVFLFGAKAAPGYRRAKAIIKFLHAVADKINYDTDVNRKMQVLFVRNYNVSYAEKLIPAADISEQISTAGTEASGTSNMKFMLNGAVTLGTYDGANIEILEQAGEENNYVFGARVGQLQEIGKTYQPKQLYVKEPRIRRVVDCLIDGSLPGADKDLFQELYDSLLSEKNWPQPDQYFLLYDFLDYCDAKRRAIKDAAQPLLFAKKALANVSHAGLFSSDRTIKGYASDIWRIEP